MLKEYADARGIDTSNYSFLTGPPGAIGDLLTQFGVLAQPEGDILKHTLATLLIDSHGKIIWRADGSDWELGRFRRADAQGMSSSVLSSGSRRQIVGITAGAAVLLLLSLSASSRMVPGD